MEVPPSEIGLSICPTLLKVFEKAQLNDEESGWIYPDDISKYTGSYIRTRKGYKATISCRKLKFVRECESKREIEDYIKTMNIQNNFPIDSVYRFVYDEEKNIDHYEVKVYKNGKTKGPFYRVVKLDYYGMLLFNEYPFSASFSWIIDKQSHSKDGDPILVRKIKTANETNGNIERKTIKFDEELMKCDRNHKVFHLNENLLDNRAVNLAVVPKNAYQPRKLATNNTSGIRGVNLHRKAWRVEWTDLTGKNREKSFGFEAYGGDRKALALAAEFRMKIDRELCCLPQYRTNYDDSNEDE